MSGWTKLFSSIVTSSVWCEDYATRLVWVAMLSQADADGVVEGSVPGFANIARVTVDEMRAAVAKLSAPDPDSRTQDHEGRRIETIQGGWLILNHLAYRNRGQGKDGSRAPYMREYRRRQKGGVTDGVTEGVTRNTDTDTEAEAEKRKRIPARSARGRRAAPVPTPSEQPATDNGNGAGKTTARQRPGWVSRLGDALKQRRGGTGDYGRIGKELAELVKEHGADEVLTRWARYLDAPSYFGPRAFAVDFGRWAADAPTPASGNRGRPSVGEQAMAEADKFIKGSRP